MCIRVCIGESVKRSKIKIMLCLYRDNGNTIILIVRTNAYNAYIVVTWFLL